MVEFVDKMAKRGPEDPVHHVRDKVLEEFGEVDEGPQVFN